MVAEISAFQAHAKELGSSFMTAFSRRKALASMGAGFLASVNRLDAIIAQGPSDRHRATDGDEEARVDWSDGLTITVGQKSGDIVGHDDKAIQAAVDYVTDLEKERQNRSRGLPPAKCDSPVNRNPPDGERGR